MTDLRTQTELRQAKATLDPTAEPRELAGDLGFFKVFIILSIVPLFIAGGTFLNTGSTDHATKVKGVRMSVLG